MFTGGLRSGKAATRWSDPALDPLRAKTPLVGAKYGPRNTCAVDTFLTLLLHVLTYEEMVLPELKQAYANSLASYKDDRMAWPPVLMAYENYTRRRIELIDRVWKDEHK